MISLGIGFLLVAVATWFVPRRFFIYVVWYLTLCAALLWLVWHRLTAPDDRELLFQLGGFLIAVAAAAIVLSTRAAFLIFSTISRSGTTRHSPKTVPAAFDQVGAVATGGMIALAAASALASAFEGYQPAWVSPVIALIIAATTILSAVELLRRSRLGRRRMIRATAGALFGFSGALSTVLLIVLVMLFSLRNEIEDAAAGDSYCVQVVDQRNSQRSPPTLLDLSLLSQGSLFHPHPRSDDLPIVIQRKGALTGIDWPDDAYRYGFSSQERFISEATPVFCNPRHEFLRSIPLFNPPTDAPLVVRFGREYYEVPVRYSPTSRGGNFSSLAFKVDRFTLREAPTDDDRALSVLVTLNPSRIKEELSVDHLMAGSREEKFGLQSVRSGSGRIIYYQIDTLGEASTLIACEVASTGGHCKHAFADQIGLISFSYPLSDVAHWKSFEKELAALVASWASH
jgi:hypothetical protein